MSTQTSAEDTLVHSYLYLRRIVGVVGTALPLVLIVGKQLLQGGGLLESISGYYYSDMRGVLVGGMCVIGAILLAYRGYGPTDDVAADIAAVAAIGVALFPTMPPHDITRTQRALGIVHLGCAAVFFLTLAFFCLVLFTRTGDLAPTRRKLQRNAVYRTCGIVILVSLALLVLLAATRTAESLHPVLWLEGAATLAFGFAWLTKGEAILQDITPPAPVRVVAAS